jgi:L-seryl-tRNA(Ser) seleniumtransferase
VGSKPQKSPSLRELPSVDQLITTSQAARITETYGRPLTLDAIRQSLEEARSAFPGTRSIPDSNVLLNRVREILEEWTSPSLQPVINATGVIIHTNLGRAPLSLDALRAIERVSAGYVTLEYDLEKGKRGSRLVHTEKSLARLTGAEAALVVNNNASAVLLVLAALARRRKVIVSRSQLVEIGGGFRVPDIMRQSGARLLEIGTTNRVHLADYEAALDESPAIILKVHRSNFQIIGFTMEPALREICDLAHSHHLPVVDDLGSGSLLDTSRFGLDKEPMVQESLQDGADLVCFSGDKLLGGPQAGVIVGRKDLIVRLRKHPLARAVRPDKLCLAALAATLDHYLRDEAEREIPIWRMIALRESAIHERAGLWSIGLDGCEVIPGRSTVGGGSLPGQTLPTWLLALRVASPDRFLQLLRRSNPPIIARVEEERVVFDPRTILEEQGISFLEGLQRALSTEAASSARRKRK